MPLAILYIICIAFYNQGHNVYLHVYRTVSNIEMCK